MKSTTDYKAKPDKQLSNTRWYHRLRTALKIFLRILTSQQYMVVTVRYKEIRNDSDLKAAMAHDSQIIKVEGRDYEEQIQMLRTSRQVLDVAHTIIKKIKYKQ